MTDHREAPAPTLGETIEGLVVYEAEPGVWLGRLIGMPGVVTQADSAEGAMSDLINCRDSIMRLLAERAEGSEPVGWDEIYGNDKPRAERAEPDGARKVLDAYKITAECRKCAFNDGRHYPGCPNEGVGFPVSLLASAPQRAGTEGEKGERGRHG